MKWTPEIEGQILAAITKKMPKDFACPLCGNPHWTIERGFIITPMQKDSQNLSVSGGVGLLAVPISCTNCGNTHLLNLLQLGLRELFKDQVTKVKDTEPIDKP